MKKIAILGCGQLGSIVADAIASGLLPGYTLCAAMSRKLPDAEALCAKAGGAACVTLDEVLAQKPDYVVETAAVQVAKESCLPVLEAGLGFIPISIGAFADADFYAKACAAAKAHGGRIYLPHGAVGGFDVLHTVALMAKAKNQPITAEIHTHKGPASLKNTPLFTEELMTTPEKTVLAGTAAEAIQVLPTKVNVAVAAALASIGPDAMGAKITIDSATMMNKGLEVIEAMRLYRLPLAQVSVMVHPQSIVHSMVEFKDGAVLAQLGTPDMRLPIRYAMTYPERGENPAPPLDLLNSPPLTFLEPDRETFPCLRLAEEAAEAGGTACAILNGANEEAVRLFLAEKIGFYDISDLVAAARATVPVTQTPSLEEILSADHAAREAVKSAFARRHS